MPTAIFKPTEEAKKFFGLTEKKYVFHDGLTQFIDELFPEDGKSHIGSGSIGEHGEMYFTEDKHKLEAGQGKVHVLGYVITQQ